MRREAVAVGAVLLLALGALPAAGAHWRNSSTLYRADDRDGRVTFHACDLTTNFQNAFDNNNSHDISPTDILVTAINGCSEEDVRMTDATFNQTTNYGWWECHSIADSNTCAMGHVHIDLDERNYSAGDALSLTCEEIAHSVGLGHRPDSQTETCLKQLWSTQHLDVHDTNVIDSNY